jgi:hypothetical protein
MKGALPISQGLTVERLEWIDTNNCERYGSLISKSCKLGGGVYRFKISTRKYFDGYSESTVRCIKFMKTEDQQDATIRCLLLTSVSACFGLHYARNMLRQKLIINIYFTKPTFCTKTHFKKAHLLK